MNARSHNAIGFAPDPTVPRRRSRTSGYIGSIVIDVIFIYAVQHLLDWNVPWITSAWSDAAWVVSLSLTISIVANALLLAYDEAWFHNLVEFVAISATLLAAYWMYVVLPFDFGSEWNSLAHLVFVAVLIALAIATAVTAVLAIVEVLRAGWRELTQP